MLISSIFSQLPITLLYKSAEIRRAKEFRGEDRAGLDWKGQRESKEEEREAIRMSEVSSVDVDPRIVPRIVPENRTVEEKVEGERFQVRAGSASVRSTEEGEGGLQGERKSNKVMVRPRERGNGASHGTAEPREYKVKLVPGPVGGRRRGECYFR